MLIDWFTVGAQALNFLILVWLLKRFLYKPILDAIDAREKRIAAELADADAKKAEAEKERDEFQHKNEKFDRQRAALLSKATEEAGAERRRLLDGARKDADALSARRAETLRSDARQSQSGSFSVGRKRKCSPSRERPWPILPRASLEDRMVHVFTGRLRRWTEAKEAFAKALRRRPIPPSSAAPSTCRRAARGDREVAQ